MKMFFFFIMKARSIIYTAILAIAAGVALIFFNKNIHSEGVVITGGVLFIIAAILNLLISYSERKNNGVGPLATTFGVIGDVGALLLGICMLLFRPTFVTLVPYIFGIIVAFLACYQFFVLAIGARPASLSVWFYLVPIILIVGAIYIFMCHAQHEDDIIMLVTGISLCFFGLFNIIEASMIPHLRNKIAEKEEEKKLKPLDATQNESETSENKEENADVSDAKQ